MSYKVFKLNKLTSSSGIEPFKLFAYNDLFKIK